MSMVIRHCNQLRVLNLCNLRGITGMFALCEDPEFNLFYNSMVYDILTAGSTLYTKPKLWTVMLAGIIQHISS